MNNIEYRILPDEIAARYCLVSTGIGTEGDRVAMLAALATYNEVGARHAVPEHIPGIETVAVRQGLRPRPGAGTPWSALAPVYSAASAGAEAADANLEAVFEATGTLARAELAYDVELYALSGGRTAGFGLEDDVLYQLYATEIAESRALIKEICGLAAGVDMPGLAGRFSDRVARFDIGLRAIEAGAPLQGVAGPPSEGIRRELIGANTAWSRVREIAKRARAGREMLPDDILRFARALDEVRDHMWAARTLLLDGRAARI